jgi:hypothetical protein
MDVVFGIIAIIGGTGGLLYMRRANHAEQTLHWEVASLKAQMKRERADAYIRWRAIDYRLRQGMPHQRGGWSDPVWQPGPMPTSDPDQQRPIPRPHHLSLVYPDVTRRRRGAKRNSTSAARSM